jgi:hypothetical protein
VQPSALAASISKPCFRKRRYFLQIIELSIADAIFLRSTDPHMTQSPRTARGLASTLILIGHQMAPAGAP